MTRTLQDCTGTLHPKAAKGIRLFNEGKFFEAHEELEIAWNEEPGLIRNLYRGILQIAVTYLHITRGNYDGAVKVYGRSLKWMKDWDVVCRGINIAKLLEDAGRVMEEIERLGKNRMSEFDPAYFKPIVWEEKRIWVCDRCGNKMIEKNCKVTCSNCGNRFDCSDLNLYFD